MKATATRAGTTTRPSAERAVKRVRAKTSNRPAEKTADGDPASQGAALKASRKPDTATPVTGAVTGAVPGVGLGPLPEFVGYMLRRAQIAVFDDFMRPARAIDLRPGQFSTLLIVEANPGAKQSDVAAALGIQGTNFVAMINQLERRKLVERRALDRRSYGLHLTGEGKALLRQAMKLQDAQEKTYEDILGPGGRRTLLELLAKLTDGLEKA